MSKGASKGRACSLPSACALQFRSLSASPTRQQPSAAGTCRCSAPRGCLPPARGRGRGGGSAPGGFPRPGTRRPGRAKTRHPAPGHPKTRPLWWERAPSSAWWSPGSGSWLAHTAALPAPRPPRQRHASPGPGHSLTRRIWRIRWRGSFGITRSGPGESAMVGYVGHEGRECVQGLQTRVAADSRKR